MLGEPMSSEIQNVSASCLIASPFDEKLLTDAASGCLERLGDNPDLVIALVSSDYRPHINKLVEILQIDGHAKTIAGASAGGIFGVGTQQENVTGISLLFLKLPGVKVKVDIPEGKKLSTKFTLNNERIFPKATILLGNPVSTDLSEILEKFNSKLTETPVIGGLITGGPEEEDLFLFTEKGKRPVDTMAIHLFGRLHMETLVSQTCRPIGHPYVITGSGGNDITSIGRRKAYDALKEAFSSLGSLDQELADGNVFAGIAAKENVDEFQTGDFLIRRITSTDLEDGSLTLDSPTRVGQTIQFQLRDPEMANRNLSERCQTIKEEHGDPTAIFVASDVQRSMAFYEETNEDATIITSHFGESPVAGFFANREIAPIEGSNRRLSLSLAAGLIFLDSPEAPPEPSSVETE